MLYKSVFLLAKELSLVDMVFLEYLSLLLDTQVIILFTEMLVSKLKLVMVV